MMKITNYCILALYFYVEFAWLGTRENTTRHLQTLIEPSTFDNQRWMKEQKNLSLTTMMKTPTKVK